MLTNIKYTFDTINQVLYFRVLLKRGPEAPRGTSGLFGYGLVVVVGTKLTAVSGEDMLL